MITVTTPATVFNLVDLSVVRAALDVPDNSDDAALTGFISRASDVIARHCNRVFALETVTEQFRLDELRAEIILSRYPVVEITSVVSDNGTTLAVSDYEVDKAKGIISRLYNDRACYWPACKSTIVYSAGYELPAGAPEALQQACIQLVKSYAMGADRDPMVTSESTDALSSASFHRDTGHLPPDVHALLRQFRKIK
jgi:hypothetical protein